MKKLFTALRALPKILLLLFFFASPLTAQSSNTHEVQIYPGVETAPLRIAGWLDAGASSYQVELITAPSFGSFQDESYLPSEEFWSTGADRLSIRVNTDQTSETHIFLFTPLVLTNRSILTTEGFEHGIPASWTQEGHGAPLSILSESAFTGSHSLAVTISAGSISWLATNDSLGGGATGYGGAGGTLIVPPDDPIDLAGSAMITALGDLEVELGFVAATGFAPGYYRMRVVAPAGLCQACTTPWRRVPSDTPTRFDLWVGAKTFDSFHDPTEGPWSVRFDLTVTGQQTSTDWLDGNFDADTLRLGILGPASGMEGVKVVFDDIITYEESHLWSSLGHVAQDFESHDTNWPAQGTAGSLTSSAISGDWGWVIDTDALIGYAGTQSAILVDLSPKHTLTSGGEVAVTALMKVDIGALNLVDGNAIQLFRGSSKEDLDGGLHLSLILYRLNGQYQLRARARDDKNVEQKTPWHPLGQGQHDLAIQWRASRAPGANNGEVRFWVNGQLAGEATGLDNDTKTLEALGFGAHRPVLSGSVAPGELFIDDLASFPGQ